MPLLYPQSILHDLETRESQFNSVQDRGSTMVLDRHPAAETIKVRTLTAVPGL